MPPTRVYATHLADVYTFGTGNSCPTGFSFIVSTADCKAATRVLAPGHYPEGAYSGTDYGTDSPTGCFYDGGDNGGKNVYFNTSPGGDGEAGDKVMCRKGPRALARQPYNTRARR